MNKSLFIYIVFITTTPTVISCVSNTSQKDQNKRKTKVINKEDTLDKDGQTKEHYSHTPAPKSLKSVTSKIQELSLPVMIYSEDHKATNWIKLTPKEIDDLLPKSQKWREGSQIYATGKIRYPNGTGILYQVVYPKIDESSEDFDYQDTTSYVMLVMYDRDALRTDNMMVALSEYCVEFSKINQDNIIVINHCEMEDIHIQKHEYEIKKMQFTFIKSESKDFEMMDDQYFKKSYEYLLEAMGFDHKISGIVIDTLTSQPIQDVNISSGEFYAGSIRQPKTTNSDEQGKFTLYFKSMDQGSTELIFKDKDYKEATFKMRSEEQDTVYLTPNLH